MCCLPIGNDKEGTEKVIRENKDCLAAVLTEGLQTGGTIAPKDGYLKFLREITSKYGVVLIFDEIVNFWLSHGGTGELYDVKPDLNCYGKGIGGGLPMGLIGGRSDIMKLFSQAEKFRVAAIVAHQFHGRAVGRWHQRYFSGTWESAGR